jgi:hypothetical protein
MANKEALKHPAEARFLLPLYYSYIENELPKICKKNGANYEEESKKVLEAAMIIGDAFWDQLGRGIKLLNERFGR